MNTETQMTEQAMRELFSTALRGIADLRDGVLTQLVSHTQQASELDRLKQQFDDLSQRFTSVVDEAQRVRQDLSLVIGERDKYKREAEENLNLAQTYERERNEAREQVNNSRIDLDRSTHDLSQAHNRIESLERDLNRTQDQLNWRTDQNQGQAHRIGELLDENTGLRNKLKDAEIKLGRMQDAYKSVFATVEDLPGKAPSFQETSPANPPHPVQTVGETGYDNPGSDGNEQAQSGDTQTGYRSHEDIKF